MQPSKIKNYSTSLEVAGSICGEVIGFFNWLNPSNSSMALGSPLTEMSTGNIKVIMFLGSKMLRVRGAHNLNAICEPIV
jgi:hypothetical protein